MAVICDVRQSVSKIFLTIPGARWPEWALTNHHCWCRPNGCLHRKSLHVHICPQAPQCVNVRSQQKLMSDLI